ASLEHVRVAVRALRRVEDDDARAVDPVITEAAETCTPSELAQLLAHIKDQMAPEAVDDDAGAALDRNRLDVSTTFEGNVELSGHLEPTSGAIVSEAISAFSAPVTGADGRPDDRTPKQRRAAALVEICRRAMADRDPASRGGISQLLLLVDGRPLVDSDEPVDVVPEDPSRAAHPHHADYCAGGDACGGTPDSRLEAALLELLATACPEESERAEERAIQAAHLRLADPPADAGDDASGEAVWRPPRAGPLSAQSVDGRPVSRPALEHLSCDARVGLAVMPDTTAALLPRALRRGRHDPLWLGRSQRVIPASLRRALVLRDRGCVHPHCNRPASWCEAHHRIPWLYGGLTDLENTMLVCSYHHHWLHAHGMNLQRRVDGTWELVIDLLTRELRGGPASRPLAHSAT
ncbi:MAG TPA: DUF222 domain-containing protein, partial [Mycobacteriales bacterium]|nr:DUF222 domain-containing protein [Mycobacteriales bacterium]